MLSELLRKLDRLDEERGRVAGRIEELLVPYQDLLRRLATIPGVDRTTALVLLAEFGEDMLQFPTSAHLASWAGLCPDNAESAGKRFSVRTRKGDRYVRRHPGAECLGCLALPRRLPGRPILPHRTTSRNEEGVPSRCSPHCDHCLAYSR
jgi:transposase